MPPDHLCRTCRQRLDSVLWSVGRHPGCRTAGPLVEQSLDRLIAYLADAVGAIPIRTNQQKETQ